MTAVSGSDIPPLVEHGSVPRSISTRIKDIWEFRELLGNLVRRELKVRYKDSFLGFIWTLLNPLLYLAVFSVVFGFILKGSPPRYGLLLLSGLLVWNLFSVGLSSATSSIVGNGALVQKVWFPREILPLAAVGASFVSFCFQMIVLVAGLTAFGHVPELSMLWLLVPGMLITMMLATGLGLILGAYNVYYRDTMHFLELGLLAWFWFSPIVYTFDFVADEAQMIGPFNSQLITGLNPMMGPMVAFQRVLYNPENLTQIEQDTYFSLMLDHGVGFFVALLAISFVFAVVALAIGIRTFSRLEGDFGEAI